MRQVVDVSGGMCGKARVREEGRRGGGEEEWMERGGGDWTVGGEGGFAVYPVQEEEPSAQTMTRIK